MFNVFGKDGWGPSVGCRANPEIVVSFRKGCFFIATAAARISRGEYVGWWQSRYPTRTSGLSFRGSFVAILDACGEFTGGVGGLGDVDALPLCPLAPPRAAITSSRTELLLKRESSLSAVSGLLGLGQCSVANSNKLCTDLLRAASFSATIGFQRILAFRLIRFAPLAINHISPTVSILTSFIESHLPGNAFAAFLLGLTACEARHLLPLFFLDPRTACGIRDLENRLWWILRISCTHIHAISRRWVWYGRRCELVVRREYNSESREASGSKFVRRTRLVHATPHMGSIVFTSEVVPMCQSIHI